MSALRDDEARANVRARIRTRALIATSSALVIGASTGGPQALSSLLSGLSPHLDNIPVLVVLHMPPDFTDVVSGQIERVTGRPTRAARNGEEIKPGQIYFAPGDCHMKVAKLGTNPILLLSNNPAENFCRPAVNVLFRSAAQVYGRNALAIVLTGMGSDGLDGARALVRAGATVIAQDQATSVVWGMPGAVVQEGLASAVLPLDKMATQIAAWLRGHRAGVAA